MKTLNQYFRSAVKEKEEFLKQQTAELTELKKLTRISSKLSVGWNSTINYKNASKAVKVAEILVAFRERVGSIKSYNEITDVRLTTKQLWRLTHHPNITGTLGPSTKFRSYLTWMKSQDLLMFDESGRTWILTPKAIIRLGHV
ncbi:hypothetical protein [Hellea balneolensis]|uniref:hypothetical protein n=1 Tax=Hellea balneolensis TaxID=287478 RepID=UPI00047D88FE|nr:hypothetical protein [Hellea balneolensis]